MKKLILNFPLHKPFCYIPTIILLVTIIAICNNYFFYRNKDIQMGVEIQNTQKIISTFYESCLEFSTEQQCKSQLINSINQTWSKGQITILDHNQNEILDLNRENYKDHRNTISKIASSGQEAQKITIISSRLSSPPLWSSTWNTMTFSFFSVIEKLMKRELNWFYFTSTVIPRSSAAIYAYITIGLVIGLFLLGLKTLQRQRQILEYRLNKQSGLREKLEEDRHELLVKLDLGEQSIQSLYQSKAELSREKQQYWDEYVKTEDALAIALEKEKEFLLQLQLQTKSSPEVVSTEDKDAKTALIKTLFKNPNVKMQDRLTTYDANFHEGKEWIATVCESFLKDEKASKLILALNSGAFDRNKRGKAEIWYENKSWKLLIYDFKHDKGISVEVKLAATTYAEAVLITKYLSTVGKFKSDGYNLNFSDRDFASMGASRS